MKTAEKTNSLKPLIGTWSIEGVNISAAPESRETPVTGIWKVEAMAGGKFLESHWEYDSGSDKHIGISILGTPNDDPRTKIFNFDNGGFYRAYDLNIDGQTWNIQGETERAVMEFDADGGTYKEFWEIRSDGQWLPLCRRAGKRHLD